MNRLPAVLAALAFVAAFSILATAQAPRAFSVFEATIPEMQRAMSEGRTTSRELVRSYLTRIGTYDHLLHAVLAVNPKALEEAALRDRERAGGHVRGPLHGIPVALKDNIQTTMMPTTGGALAFERFVPPYEATLVANLRAAGAVIIAKTGMTELANWVAGDPTPMPTNYNAIGRLRFQSVRSAPRSARRHVRRTARAADGRVELRHRHVRQLLGGERRHRDLGIDSQSVEPEHARGDQADGRAHQPLRRHPDHRGSGHGRADGQNGDRCGDHARRARKRVARSARSGDTNVHAAAGPRLHAVPARRRAERRAHRNSSRVLLRSRRAAGTTGERRRRAAAWTTHSRP